MCNIVHATLAVCHVGGFLKMKTIAVVRTGELIIVMVCISFDSEAMLVEEAVCDVESRKEFHSL